MTAAGLKTPLAQRVESWSWRRATESVQGRNATTSGETHDGLRTDWETAATGLAGPGGLDTLPTLLRSGGHGIRSPGRGVRSGN